MQGGFHRIDFCRTHRPGEDNQPIQRRRFQRCRRLIEGIGAMHDQHRRLPERGGQAAKALNQRGAVILGDLQAVFVDLPDPVHL